MAEQVEVAAIESTPAAGQTVEHEGIKYNTIKEGLAHILVPPNAKTITDPKATKQESGEKAQNVFYNPIQQFNRDLSVLAIRAFSEDFAERRKQRAEKKSEGALKKRERRQQARKEREAKKAANETTDPTTANGANETTQTQRPDDKLRSAMRILDALSATGLRALRYASELPLPVNVVANDLLDTATAAIKLNVRHNKLTSQIQPTTSNAQAHMYNAAFGFSSHAYAKYDVIDLDPYGTAVPFIESALLALNDNGLLCVTCTDAGVFNSMGYLEKTYALYGGLPVKGLHAHEAGLRLILNSIATTAAKHGLSIEPLLSLSIDFYARVFVRVRRSPAEVKFLASKTMSVHSCDSGCGSWAPQPLARTSVATGANGSEFFKYHPAQTSADKRCEHCGFRTHLAGPMWGGPLHNPFFIARILNYLPSLSDDTYATKDRIEGMLTTALDELDSDAVEKDPKQGGSGILPALPPHQQDPHPFAFSVSALSRVLHCQAPPEAAIRGALRGMGYVATRSHTKAGLIKTQAPWSVVWEVMREWIRQRAPVKEGSVRKGTAGWGILHGGTEGEKDGAEDKEAEKEVKEDPGRKREIVFDETLGKDKAKPAGRKLVRYQMNPRDNWGPMSRAKG
ncbi:N2,N2-dimethylguanosine tRNA methyltransferase [Myriangium duriaei CBS 260.36]|uniref:tRNA (guanine(26)-N(2))-dimethyltransferase n=1 Tax=Myriangium duriaei CBS 260.36 TaxID=1168546 RepID=A0A9P4J7E5_9PEZI|nr:N2,N2-dimethylguanosine tRNA methyltransferase [Myriangium duriaei CBS 260.36]